MGRGEDSEQPQTGRRFSPLYGSHPRHSRPARQRPVVHMGGASSGVTVRLDASAEPSRVKLIRALSTVTGMTLRWAKDVHDLTQEGKLPQVTVDPEKLDKLTAAGWLVAPTEDGERVLFQVSIPAGRAAEFKGTVEEFDGKLL